MRFLRNAALALLAIALCLGATPARADDPPPADSPGTLAPDLTPDSDGAIPTELLGLPQEGVGLTEVREYLAANAVPATLTTSGRRASVFKFDVAAADAADVAAALTGSGLFQAVDYNAMGAVESYTDSPDDPGLAGQWNLQPSPGSNFINAWPLLANAAPPEDFPIALLDTGFDMEHADKGPNIVPGYDFADDDYWPDDTYGHGTQMGGVIAAATNNAFGLAGASWDAKVLVYRLSANGQISDDAVVDGIYAAVADGAKIINMSLGKCALSSVVATAMDYAASRGVILVAAAGNLYNPNEPQCLMYPASYKPAVSVSGTQEDGTHDPYTMMNDQVDISAPSSIFPAFGLNSTWGSRRGGTSSATAAVSAAASLVWRANPELSSVQVKEFLFLSNRLNAANAMSNAVGVPRRPAEHVMITNIPTDLEIWVLPGNSGSLQLRAILEGSPDAQITFTSANLPSWMTLTESGLLSYTLPQGLGSANEEVRVRASAAEGIWDETPILFHLLPGCSGSVQLTGTLRVGQPMTASGVTCPRYTGVTYSWEREGYGEVGTSQTYTPTHEDLGHRLIATITGTHPNGGPQVFSLRSERSVRYYLDVPSNQRFYDAINYLAWAGVASHGANNDNFWPERELSRGEIAAYFYRLLGSPNFTAPATPTFSDVPNTHMFYREIEWLYSMRMTSGKGAGTFMPEDTVTRGEIAAFLHRYHLLFNPNTPVAAPVPSYQDVPKTHTFYSDIEWMRSLGLASAETYFHPARACARDEFAAFVYRYVNR
ncbi:MAG: S8 family serine peptidase [Propionibacteriaceae bacterium]|jgi:hypothetical protein|nr:S8 family serine peptidase [Propionibacteriaceae bacterium]